jgi:dipeptidyl aminopeptidase/acylaminoacyl peptidase
LVGARDALMRASTYHRSSEFYLQGLDDAAALRAWRASRETFVKAAKLTPWKFEVMAIPFEKTTLSAYFFQPPGDGARPTLLLDNGFDGTQEESYFNIGLAALERGYNVLTFEGPGQGAAIREQGLGFRHDWEKLVAPVVGAAVSRPEVDGARIALMGVSLAACRT